VKNNEYLEWILNFKWNYSFDYYPYNNRETNVINMMKNLHKNELVDYVFYLGMQSTKKERVLTKKSYTFLYYTVLFSGTENNWTDNKLARILNTKDAAKMIYNFDIIKDRRKTCEDVVNQMQQKITNFVI
jgi:hypothetical protein